MSSMASPGSGSLELIQRIEALEKIKICFDVENGMVMRGKIPKGIYLIIISYANGANSASAYIANSDDSGIMRITPLAEGTSAPTLSNYDNIITANKKAHFIALKLI